MTAQRAAWPTGIEVGCALVVAAIALLIGWNATDQARTYQVRTQIAIVPTDAQTPEQAAAFMNSPIP